MFLLLFYIVSHLSSCINSCGRCYKSQPIRKQRKYSPVCIIGMMRCFLRHTCLFVEASMETTASLDSISITSFYTLQYVSYVVKRNIIIEYSFLSLWLNRLFSLHLLYGWLSSSRTRQQSTILWVLLIGIISTYYMGSTATGSTQKDC